MTLVLLTKFRKPSVLAGGFFFFVLISLSSCANTNQAGKAHSALSPISEIPYLPQEFVWQPVKNADFAQYFFFKNQEIPLRYHCLKINLADDSLEILTYPNSDEDFFYKQGEKTEFFTGLTARQFSKKFDSAVTVNAAPFEGKNGGGKLALLGSTRKICGIHVAGKKTLSAPLKKYGALCLKKGEHGYIGTILKSQTEKAFADYDFAFGGFFTILEDFKKQDFPKRTADSRTVLALSEDGKTLYILVVEGEKRLRSIGLSYQDCADIMLALGAKNAIQMDGGGSTSLFVNGENALSYSSFRKNAVFIGFKKD